MKFIGKIGKHSDMIFLGSVILGVLVGAGVLYSHWQVVEGYWEDTNFEVYSVDPENIVSGGIKRDSRVAPIDSPVFAPASIASYNLDDADRVVLVDYDGAGRAYPLQILAVHQVVNDNIGNLPVAVTYCPLCNSAVVYHREIDGQTLRMGVTGNFYGNNFLMYDDLTQSWWYQFTGEAIVGDFTGKQLQVIPSQTVGFRAYVTRYPQGDVLIGDASQPNVNYDLTPYEAYQSSRSPALLHDDYDRRLGAMTQVLSTRINGVPIAYPYSALEENGIINDEVAGESIVVFWQPASTDAYNNVDIQATDEGHATSFSRELGMQTLTFRYDNGRIFDNETGSEWNIFGEAIAGELEGDSLHALQCFTMYWFAWSSAHPSTIIYGQ